MRIRIATCLLAVALPGCQTTGLGTHYSAGSVSSQPYRESYKTDLEFAIDLTIHMYPRRCVFFSTSDGVRSGANQRPEQFSFTQIISNKFDDRWFLAVVQPTNARRNALSFYVNGRTGEWACGSDHLRRVAPSLKFENAKFHEVSAIKATMAPPKAASETAVEVLDGDTRAIVMTWEGFEKPVTGLISLRQSRDGGAVNLVLPESIIRCSGEFTMTTKSEGEWSVTCANGRKALGTLTAFGSGKGSTGIGKDDLGRSITYIVGTR